MKNKSIITLVAVIACFFTFAPAFGEKKIKKIKGETYIVNTTLNAVYNKKRPDFADCATIGEATRL